MKEDEKKLQKKYMEMKMMEEQMGEIQKQATMAEQQLLELTAVTQGLGDFKNAKVGDEILVPISAGIFAKAELKDNNEFLVNVGANAIVNKDIDATRELMEKQIEEVRTFHSRMMIEMQKLAINASSIETELKELASKLQ